MKRKWIAAIATAAVALGAMVYTVSAAPKKPLGKMHKVQSHTKGAWVKGPNGDKLEGKMKLQIGDRKAADVKYTMTRKPKKGTDYVVLDVTDVTNSVESHYSVDDATGGITASLGSGAALQAKVNPDGTYTCDGKPYADAGLLADYIIGDARTQDISPESWATVQEAVESTDTVAKGGFVSIGCQIGLLTGAVVCKKYGRSIGCKDVKTGQFLTWGPINCST